MTMGIRHIISGFLFFFLIGSAFAQKIDRFGQVLTFQVKTDVASDSFPAIVSNKDWAGGRIISLESNSNYGQTLTSGVRRGWTFFLQPNGALGWNLGNEKQRVDYLPTVRRRINDGRWHEIACLIDLEQEAMWLWLDEEHLTTYNLRGMDIDSSMIRAGMFLSDHPDIKIRKLRWNTHHRDHWKLSETVDNINVVNWNIWHGGRHNGGQDGVRDVIRILSEQDPDIICLQETYGSGPTLADSLNMIFYSISSNLSILSRYPIRDIYNHGWDSFRFGGANIQIGKEQSIAVFDIWLHYLPNTDQMLKEQMPMGDFMSAEMRTRGREMLLVHKAIGQLGLDATMPRLMAGDFNSGSHLDWTARTAQRHGNQVVQWPTSRTMVREGYQDVWRTLHPDEVSEPGYTWSPRFRDQLQYRIDYIYTDQQNWSYLESTIQGYELREQWPSDHAMVTARLQLTGPVRP